MNLPLPTIDLVGSPRDRGRAYGAQTKDLIDTSIAYYEELFGVQTGMTWREVTQVAAQWEPVCQSYAPDLVEEVRGLAEGSGRDFLEILTLNARGEIAYDRGFADDSAEEDPPDGCTSFALLPQASGDGRMYCGQNWDWHEPVRPTVVVIRIVQPPAPTVIMHVEAGQIGRQGANSAGIALNANGLGGRFDDTVGVPQSFIRRRVLDSPTIYDALQVISKTEQHIASNAIVSHRDGFAIDMETTPGPHAAIRPTNGVLVHGNHYQALIPPQLADRHRPRPVDSLYRVPRVEAGLSRLRDADTSDLVRSGIHSAMSDHFGYPHSVCTHPDPRTPQPLQWSTLLSSCVDLTTGEYLLAAGAPCNTPYASAPWNLYDGPDGLSTPRVTDSRSKS